MQWSHVRAVSSRLYKKQAVSSAAVLVTARIRINLVIGINVGSIMILRPGRRINLLSTERHNGQGFHGSCRANLWAVSGSYSIEICYWGRNTNKWLNGLWYEKRLSSAIFKINLAWEKSKVEWNLIQRIRLAANRIWWRCGWSLAKSQEYTKSFLVINICINQYIGIWLIFIAKVDDTWLGQ